MSLYPVLSQLTYPGAGDVDDCAIVSTFWAARAAGYVGTLPTIHAFREAAGKPDKPGPSGLTQAQVWRGVEGTILGTQRPTEWRDPWPELSQALKGGATASLAVLSSLLPAHLQFGFTGYHRVGVQYAGRFYVANPLARDGASPLPITETALAAAAIVVGLGRAEAVTFPTNGVPDVLKLNDTTPKTVDIAAGKQLYKLDGSPAVKTSVKQNDVYSPFTSGIFRAVGITTGGVYQLLLAKIADCSDARPVGDVEHTVAVWIDGTPKWSETL